LDNRISVLLVFALLCHQNVGDDEDNDKNDEDGEQRDVINLETPVKFAEVSPNVFCVFC
jgi:hypothetical protein